MSPRALFVTDLDGTLLDETGEIPPRNLEVMRRAVEAGVVLAVATGRRRSIYRRELGKLAGVPHRASCSNGAVLLAEDLAAIALTHELPWPSMLEVAARARPDGVLRNVAVTAPPPSTSPDDSEAWIVSRDGRFHAATSPWDPSTHRPVERELPLSHALVHAALHVTSRREAEALEEWMGECFGAAAEIHCVAAPLRDGALLEAVVPGGKGRAVRDLVRLLGVPPEATGAVGDDMNDAALVDAAAHRYAVGESLLAERRPDLVRTAPARDGAVADALERFMAELA